MYVCKRKCKCKYIKISQLVVNYPWYLGISYVYICIICICIQMCIYPYIYIYIHLFESQVIHFFPMETPPAAPPLRPSAPVGWPRSARRAPAALPGRNRWGRPWAGRPGHRSPGINSRYRELMPGSNRWSYCTIVVYIFGHILLGGSLRPEE